MMDYHRIFINFVVLCSIIGITQQAAKCFQFTWLGPRFNNGSDFLNATCDDATNLYDQVPCQLPLVASYDGTWPDLSYIWANHQEASCDLADNDVCAQYTYYFDGVVENSTYMCTRAVDSSGVAITSGCYTQVNGSYTTRVCLCRSLDGGFPCNDAAWMAPASMTVFLVVLLANYINNCSFI